MAWERCRITLILRHRPTHGTFQGQVRWSLRPDALQRGDCVGVTSGPFADFIGTIKKIAPEQSVWVLWELMGAQTRVAAQACVLRRHP